MDYIYVVLYHWYSKRTQKQKGVKWPQPPTCSSHLGESWQPLCATTLTTHQYWSFPRLGFCCLTHVLMRQMRNICIVFWFPLLLLSLLSSPSVFYTSNYSERPYTRAKLLASHCKSAGSEQQSTTLISHHNSPRLLEPQSDICSCDTKA